MKAGLAQNVLQQIRRRNILRPGDSVGVAVSGGADSVALLLLLLELREQLGVVLSVVHFNHKLRGRDSDGDEKFVAKLAAKHELAFHASSARVASKAKEERANLEDAARRARYQYFRFLVELGKITRIAVAHTADDQAETVLAHILRGTGLAGLGAIHPSVGPIFRPLLKIRRSELRKYLRAKKQKWREDATNRDTTRMRARIRRKLLPLLKKQFQPAIVEHLSTLADLAREDEAYLEGLATIRLRELSKQENGGFRIPAANLATIRAVQEIDGDSTSIRKRMVRKIVANIKPRAGQLGVRHVEAVMELAQAGRSGSTLTLPGGVQARRERDDLVFLATGTPAQNARRNGPREFEHTIEQSKGDAEVRLEELRCVFRLRVIDWPPKRGETNRVDAVLDRDRLRFPLVLRNWRPGDRFRPLGHRNAHKLKRLLNEKRINRWDRAGWPVLTSGEVLAWARGFPVAAEFAADERTRAGMVVAEESL